MTKSYLRRIWGFLLAGWLLIGLASCGGQAEVPSAVIDQAVILQARANQTSLWQQLALPADEVPELYVS
jgi:hypothetical protein